jgi:hypothetical protein
MRAASCSQSALESCSIHRQSIQMYSIPIHHTIEIASCKVRGNVLKLIADLRACRLVVVVVEGKLAPQQ